MGLTPAKWLIDKSALWRVNQQPVASVVVPEIVAGLVAVSIATELEVGYSARSRSDHDRLRAELLDRLVPVNISPRSEARAREVQAALIERGQHRSAGVADLLLAATAEIEGLTVWHYDADFDVIAAVTGQPTEWVVPKGSIS